MLVPLEEVLIMAVTRMLSGVCTAGFTREPDPKSDLRWRALGRRWLGAGGGELTLDQDELAKRLGAEAIYLALGLSRRYQEQFTLLVIGVHCVPDYEIEIDYRNL